MLIAFSNSRTSLDPRTQHTVWAFLIGGSFNFLATYGFNQTLVQRYICVRSTRDAKQALFINAVSSAIIILFSCFIGVIIYAYYADCDPYTAKKIEEIDQVFPYFVMEILGDKKGLPGVFLACIFSGSLSTISSGLNSLAAVLIEDFYKGLMGRQLTDQRQGFLSKIVSIILGVFVILLTYVVSYLGSILNAGLSLFGVLEGPIMGVFFLGLFFPQANRRGGLAGFLTSLAFMLWIFLGAQINKNQLPDVTLSLSITNCTFNRTIAQTMSNWTTTIKTSPVLK
jgi:sodium-dependent multivitamin transporter 6